MTTNKMLSERDRFMTDYLIRKESERKIKEREESQRKKTVYVTNEKLGTAPPTPAAKNQ